VFLFFRKHTQKIKSENSQWSGDCCCQAVFSHSARRRSQNKYAARSEICFFASFLSAANSKVWLLLEGRHDAGAPLSRNEGKVEGPNAFLTQITLAAGARGRILRGVAFCQKHHLLTHNGDVGDFPAAAAEKWLRNKRYRAPPPTLCTHTHTRGNKTVEIH
jgi:hypothetical protein